MVDPNCGIGPRVAHALADTSKPRAYPSALLYETAQGPGVDEGDLAGVRPVFQGYAEPGAAADLVQVVVEVVATVAEGELLAQGF